MYLQGGAGWGCGGNRVSEVCAREWLERDGGISGTSVLGGYVLNGGMISTIPLALHGQNISEI